MIDTLWLTYVLMTVSQVARWTPWRLLLSVVLTELYFLWIHPSWMRFETLFGTNA